MLSGLLDPEKSLLLDCSFINDFFIKECLLLNIFLAYLKHIKIHYGPSVHIIIYQKSLDEWDLNTYIYPTILREVGMIFY